MGMSVARYLSSRYVGNGVNKQRNGYTGKRTHPLVCTQGKGQRGTCGKDNALTYVQSSFCIHDARELKKKKGTDNEHMCVMHGSYSL